MATSKKQAPSSTQAAKKKAVTKAAPAAKKPAAKKAAPAKAAPAKAAPAAKKPAAKKAPEKAAAKKQPAKAAPTKKVPAAATKAPAKKAPPAKKATSKAAPAAKKSVPARTAPAKKEAPKKAPPASKAPAAKKAAPPAKKEAAKKPVAKKEAAKKAAPAKAPAQKTPAKKTAPAGGTVASREASPSYAGVREGAGLLSRRTKPVERRTEGYTDERWLTHQRHLLDAERATYVEQAQALKAEAEQLVEEMEPGDIQFDDESGEGGTTTVDRERDLALSAQALQTVEEIDHAIAKISNKTYGICENCGRLIPKPRLEALPFARLCIDCKSGGLSRR